MKYTISIFLEGSWHFVMQTSWKLQAHDKKQRLESAGYITMIEAAKR